MSTHSLTRKVGQGSREHDFVGLRLRILRTLLHETLLKDENFATGSNRGDIGKLFEVKIVRIFFIFSMKYEPNLLARDESEVWSGIVEDLV